MRTIAVVSLVTLACAGAAFGQERTKGIDVNAVEKLSGVEVGLELRTRNKAGDEFRKVCEDDCDRAGGPVRLAVGNQVAVCFRATTDGYATVWSIDSRGKFDLIYPNKFSHPAKTRGAAVKANGTTCIGEDDKFRLTIGPPNGVSKVYLHWTRTEGEQLNLDDYPVIGGKDAGSSRTPPHAAKTLQYEITSGN